MDDIIALIRWMGVAKKRLKIVQVMLKNVVFLIKRTILFSKPAYDFLYSLSKLASFSVKKFLYSLLNYFSIQVVEN
jgi:hypothetical protein